MYFSNSLSEKNFFTSVIDLFYTNTSLFTISSGSYTIDFGKMLE